LDGWGIAQTIVTVVFGVATIVLTIVTIRLTKRNKPTWAYTTRHIIGRDAEAPPELKYVFGDRTVNEVYKTETIVFNKGNDKFCGDLAPGSIYDINEPI
jgi:hypothetical protein